MKDGFLLQNSATLSNTLKNMKKEHQKSFNEGTFVIKSFNEESFESCLIKTLLRIVVVSLTEILRMFTHKKK